MLKRIFLLSLALLMCTAGVHADPLNDELFYAEPVFFDSDGNEIFTLQKGTVTSRYSITNSDTEEKEVSVIAAYYKDGVIKSISSKTESLSKKQNSFFELDTEVTELSGCKINLYAVENLKVGTPLTRLATLSEKSREADVKAFTLEGYEGKINSSAALIEVEVDYGTYISECTPEVTVSDGASWSVSSGDFSGDVTLTVTAENGDTRSYTVRTTVLKPPSVPFSADFTGDSEGTLPKGWTGSGIVCADPETGEGKVLKLDDNSNAKSVNTTAAFDEIFAPFEMTLRIRYDRADEYVSGKDDISYNWFRLSKGDVKLAEFSARDHAGSDKRWMCKGISEASVSGYELEVGKWYNVKLIYTSDNTVEFYSDNGTGYKLLKTFAPINAVSSVSKLYLYTSNGRINTTYIDDICITPLTAEEKPDAYSDGFEGESDFEWQYDGGVSAETVSDSGNASNNVLSLTSESGGYAYAEFDSIGSSTELSFDIMTSGAYEDAEIALFEAGNSNSGDMAVVINQIMAENGFSLAYTADGKYSCPVKSELESGKWYNIKIAYFYDEEIKSYRADLYVNNILAANACVNSVQNEFNRIAFFVPSGLEMMIDNVHVQSR